MTDNKKPSRDIELTLKTVDIATYGTGLMKLSKDDLREIVAPLADFLKPYKVIPTKASSREIGGITGGISDGKYFNKLLKEQYAKLYISFGIECKNIFAVACRDSKIEEAWKLIINSPEISSEDIENVLKRKLKVVTTTYWASSYYCEVFFFPLIVTEANRPYYSFSKTRETKYTFTLSTDNREILATTFFGDKVLKPIVTEKLPEGKDLRIEDFERYIPADLSFLSKIAMTGSVVSSTGSITAAKLKSLKKTFKTAEFFAWSNKWPVDRIEMLTNAFFMFKEYGDVSNTNDNRQPESTNPGKFAKFIVDKMPRCLSSTKFGVFLPAFKGFTKAWTKQTNAGIVTKIIGKLISPAAKGWMSLENLRLRYLCTGASEGLHYGYNHLFYEESRGRHTLKRKDDELDTYDTRSKGIDWFEEIDFPFVVHWIKFLCGAGLLEIAEEKDTKLFKNDALEGIRYIRLTPLGRYAYGFDNTYTATKPENTSEIEIDDRNGIITVLSDNSPYTLFLQQISIPISHNRFRITPESLLKNCDSCDKVYERLDNLELIIDVDKTPGLKAIIDKAESRVKCAEWLPDEYVMLKVKPGLPELVKLITTDKEIRPNVILAEQGIVLVKRNFLYKFKAICTNHGYLLN